MPELLLAAVFWLRHRSQVAAYPDSWSVGPATGNFEIWLRLQCSLSTLVIALTAPIFPVNRYLPEIILLGYTVCAFPVGVYFTFWGAGGGDRPGTDHLLRACDADRGAIPAAVASRTASARRRAVTPRGVVKRSQ